MSGCSAVGIGSVMLAQAGRTDPFTIVVTVGGLIGLVVVGSLVLLYVRQRQRSPSDASLAESTEALQRSGSLTKEERALIRRAVAKQMGMTADGAAREGTSLPRRRPDGTVIAAPGYDLTGRPLPEHPDEGPEGPQAG